MVRIRELDNTLTASEVEDLSYCLVMDSLATALSGEYPVEITAIGEITAATAKYSTKKFSVLSGDDPIEVSEKTYNFIKSALSYNGKILLGCEYTDDTIRYLSNRYLNIPVKFILVDEETDAVDEDGNAVLSKQSDLRSALKIVCSRKDALVILSVVGTEVDGRIDPTLQASTQEILREDCSYLSEDFFDEENIKPIGKYVGAYYGEFDEITSAEAVLIAIYNNIQNGYKIWEGFTGKEKGRIPGFVAHSDLVEDDIDAMQPDGSDTTVISEAPIAVNAIAQEYGRTVIDGNRTCLPNATYLTEESENVWVVDTSRSQLVASSFIHVRAIINDIKKAIHKACFDHKGQVNAEITWYNFISSVNKTLDEIAATDAISAYRWKRGETTERAKIVGTLTICPVDLVESFDITIDLTNDDTLSVSVVED